MKMTAKIEIECGKYTCAFAKGKFCKHFGTTRFGTLPVCLLFPPKTQDGSYTVLAEDIKDNFLTMRCDDCLMAVDKDIKSVIEREFLKLPTDKQKYIIKYIVGNDYKFKEILSDVLELILSKGLLSVLLKEIDKANGHKLCWEEERHDE